MECPSEISGFDNISFCNLIPATAQLLQGKKFINTDEAELDLYAKAVQYRVQRDLYEVCEKSSASSMTWDEFVLIMRSIPPLREQAITVIGKKLNTAYFSFDFTQQKISFFKESDECGSEILHCAKLFSRTEGIILMKLFLYFAEQAHFTQLQDTVRPDYTLEEYYNDLLHDKALWRGVMTAFRDAIQRLDFKEEWEKIDEIYE